MSCLRAFLFFGLLAPPLAGGAAVVQTDVFVSGRDGGLSWSTPQDAPGLPEPICQASIVRWENPPAPDRPLLLFSNPADEKIRMRLTVRASCEQEDAIVPDLHAALPWWTAGKICTARDEQRANPWAGKAAGKTAAIGNFGQ